MLTSLQNCGSRMVSDKVSASVCRLMLIVLLAVGNSVEQGTAKIVLDN